MYIYTTEVSEVKKSDKATSTNDKNGKEGRVVVQWITCWVAARFMLDHTILKWKAFYDFVRLVKIVSFEFGSVTFILNEIINII